MSKKSFSNEFSMKCSLWHLALRPSQRKSHKTLFRGEKGVAVITETPSTTKKKKSDKNKMLIVVRMVIAVE